MTTNPAFVPDLEKDNDVEKYAEYQAQSSSYHLEVTSSVTTVSHSTVKHEKAAAGKIALPFHEAIERVGVGKFHYYMLIVCGTGFMAVMSEVLCVGMILPSIKCDFNSTTSEQGILASAGFIGIVLGSQVVGFLADTWGRVRTLRYAFILGALATIAASFSVNTWMLIALRLLNGLFISGGQACVFTICGEFHGNKTRVKHMTWLSGFSPLGLIVIPVFAIIIMPVKIEAQLFGLPYSPWRIFLIMVSTISIAASVGLFLLPETPRYVLVQGDNEGALNILRYMYARNSGQPASAFPVDSIVLENIGNSLSNVHGFKDAMKMVWSQITPLFYRERVWHTLNICFIMFMLYVVAQGIFMWFPTIFNELVAKVDLSQEVCMTVDNMGNAEDVAEMCAQDTDITTFLFMLGFGVIFTLFYVVIGYVINFIGKRNLIIIWVGAVAICLCALHWIIGIGLAAIAIGLPASVGYCGSLINTISMEFFPTHINAGALSLNMTIGRLGAAFGSNFIAQLMFGQCELVFWILMGLMCLVVVLSFFLPERKHVK